ncbi:MAG: cyanophycin synthetase, partial [Bacilli bacterium]|nr:cyanophycin synthetase [Bacilli bacterium]
NHFLNYNYDYLIINNIEFDHPDFFKNVQATLNSFQKAADKAKYLIINADDQNSMKIKHPKIFSFGLNSGDLKANILETHNNGFRIEVGFNDEVRSFFLPFTGLHMVYNFLAALSVAYLNGINLDDIQAKLLTYQRPSRRMEEYFYYDNIIIDDYAHHPKEIEMCLSGIRQKYPDKDLIVIFQPHTYTRTLALKKEFQKVFLGVKLYLTKTFTSKRENNNEKLDREVLNLFPKARVFQVHDLKEFKNHHNTVILFLGAGNIDRYIKDFI